MVIKGVVKAADVDDGDGNSDVAVGDTSEKAATNPPSLGDNDSSAANKNIGAFIMAVLVQVTLLPSNNKLSSSMVEVERKVRLRFWRECVRQ